MGGWKAMCLDKIKVEGKEYEHLGQGYYISEVGRIVKCEMSEDKKKILKASAVFKPNFKEK